MPVTIWWQKAVSVCLGVAWAGEKRGYRETLGDDGCVHRLDHGGSFIVPLMVSLDSCVVSEVINNMCVLIQMMLHFVSCFPCDTGVHLKYSSLSLMTKSVLIINEEVFRYAYVWMFMFPWQNTPVSNLKRLSYFSLAVYSNIYNTIQRSCIVSQIKAKPVIVMKVSFCMSQFSTIELSVAI